LRTLLSGPPTQRPRLPLYLSPAEETHLENSALSLVAFRETLQCEIYSHDLFHLVRRENHSGIYRNVNCAASPFRTMFFARVIDQHMPHDLGGHGKEMRAVAPSGIYTRKKTEKRLLHQGGRLHGMVPTLGGEGAPGKPMQLRTDQR